MNKRRRQFSREFKQEAVRLSELGEKGVSALERELGLSRGQLSHWRREAQARGEDAFLGDKRSAEERERDALQAEIARLREECAILKKVLALYAEGAR
jgi:transposase